MADMEAQSTMRNQDVASSVFKKANRPITLKFEDVVYKIKIPTPSVKPTSLLKKNPTDDPESPTTEKQILKGITGIVKPGEMLAMLGPSGSGKTTLLTALGGRLGGGRLTGTVTYNGIAFSRHLKRSVGFVTQDDILYEHLTVTETLVYTALLRLQNTFTREEKVSHAEAVIAQLGLTRCKNSIIGGPFLRGVSGGERKRVSIGQEMLINPSLLFLDEPTSGLDSTTAQRIVSTLAELACGGRTVVMTIHQPSSKLFYMFDKVLLLSEGNPLYFGYGDKVMPYFDSVGFKPSVAMNPADFLLDLANGINETEETDPTETKLKLVTKYKETLESKIKSDIKELTDNTTTASQEDDAGAVAVIPTTTKWATTWWQQFTVLLSRGIKERRHEAFSKLSIIQVVTVSILVSLLWFKSDANNLQDQVGLLFFNTAFWGFYSLFQAIFTFPPEHFILAKERSSGMYRLSSYFMARTVGDLPMELVLPTAYLIIVYWTTGLKPTPEAFFYSLLSLLLSVLVSQGLGLALGALVLKLKRAIVLGSVLMLMFMLAGGFYVQHVPEFISWIKYVSVLQYTFKLMLGSQYEEGQTYSCGGKSVCKVEDFPIVASVGLGQQWVAWVAMSVMLVGYRLIAYLALMRVGAPRRKK